jgi:hypothetical protein
VWSLAALRLPCSISLIAMIRSFAACNSSVILPVPWYRENDNYPDAVPSN